VLAAPGSACQLGIAAAGFRQLHGLHAVLWDKPQRPQPAPPSHASLQRMCPVVLLQLSADCRSGLAGSQLEVGDLGITYGIIW
jgi:hypothetical protein